MPETREELHVPSSWIAGNGSTKPRRLSLADVEKRMIEEGIVLVKKWNGATKLELIDLDQLIGLAEVPKSSVYRAFKSKLDYEKRLLEAIVEIPELYATETILLKVREALHSAVVGGAENVRSLHLLKFGSLLVTEPAHHMAAQIEGAVATIDAAQIETTAPDRLREIKNMHLAMLADHLKMAHLFWGETFVKGGVEAYVADLLNAARTFALQPFPSEDPALRGLVFTTIADYHTVRR